ncbi:unnamed protein product [Phytophthora fragariaefolia]|uniref:Unnamed protein product n=1 Tax=Phytophthora fragariaefolia TaxID=1490495 RepID=A0A9W6X789_9STRA|nr:unnamed protein product [Phytophthora fragariaefolia]
MDKRSSSVQQGARRVRQGRRRERNAGLDRTRKLHQQDMTIVVTTQNVRGLATSQEQRGQKLLGFNEQHLRGKRDAIFLQETRLKANEHKAAAQQHAAMWGFKHSVADSLSMGASGDDRRAGVVILVNPYEAVRNMIGWKQELWTEHLIMVQAELAGRCVLLINIYSPSHGVTRIKFYKYLSQTEWPDEMDMICGGDFNCVLDRETDRVGSGGTRDMGMRELQAFLEKARLYDPGLSHKPHVNGRQALEDYAAAQ